MSILVGVAAVYLMVSHAGVQASNREYAAVRARIASEEGLHLSIAELRTGVDSDTNGVGTIAFVGLDGRSANASVTDLGGSIWRIHSVAVVDGARLGSEVLAQVLPTESLPFPARAAITAAGPVTTLGNINVDGRDWRGDGSGLTGDPGVFGISSGQSITIGGSSSVGGNGSAPNNPPNPAAVDSFSVWGNGADDDSDGVADEESWNGLDDDGDGLIDEDTSDYPGSPDLLFMLPEGTLAAIAQAAGTHFTTEAAFSSYLSSNGGSVPGGVIIYLAFDEWSPADMGSGFNDPPSVIVHHNPAGTALMKNLHGQFKGLLIADFVEHINGDFMMLGALMSFADDAYGNAFGNGNADVLFSSEVLGNLPAASTKNRVRVLSWRRAAVN
jgi:hypothetical protein